MSSSEDSGGPRRLSGKLVLVGGKAYVEGIIDTDDREKSRHARRRARM
jgi:hypothetical protein